MINMADMKIGEGSYGTMARKYSDKFDFISHNDASYWCHDIFGYGTLVIMKDTEEGKMLTFYLNGGISNPESLKDYLLEIIIKNISIEYFKETLDKIKKECFMNGVKYNQDQIKMVLGI
jgi:hypothetical protein